MAIGAHPDDIELGCGAFISNINGKTDILQIFLDALRAAKMPFCVIGGLAVNAYTDPVVSLDLDIVVVSDRIKDLSGSLPPGFKLKSFSNSLNISAPGADLRIQVQTDPRYQDFLSRAKRKSDSEDPFGPGS